VNSIHIIGKMRNAFLDDTKTGALYIAVSDPGIHHAEACILARLSDLWKQQFRDMLDRKSNRCWMGAKEINVGQEDLCDALKQHCQD
jgi:hypothetical protein